MKGNARRIVIIRDIPSNIIEEAIFVLKHEPGREMSQVAVPEVLRGGKGKDSALIYKEAEKIINDYIQETRTGGITSEVKCRKPAASRGTFLKIALRLGMVACMAVLAYLMVKFAPR